MCGIIAFYIKSRENRIGHSAKKMTPKSHLPHTSNPVRIEVFFISNYATKNRKRPLTKQT